MRRQPNLIVQAKHEIKSLIGYTAKRLNQLEGPQAGVTMTLVEEIIVRVITYFCGFHTGAENVQNHFDHRLDKSMDIITREITELLKNSIFLQQNLGIHLLLGLIHECIMEQRGERKAGGSYYTPAGVVELMLESSLKTDLEAMSNLLKAAVEGDDLAKLEQCLQMIKGYKVIDPSCGAGAFLTAVFSDFIEFYQQLNEFLFTYRLEHRLAVDAVEILERHIRGIDIDEDAVRLTVNALYHQGIDYCGGNYHRLLQSVKRVVKVDDSLMTADPEFSNFSLVIGNPPYIANKSIPSKVKDQLRGKFKNLVGQYDTVIPFIELGCNLLYEGGQLCYIISNKFFSSDYGEKLRKYILTEKSLRNIIDLSSEKVFEDASTYPVIIRIRNRKTRVDEVTQIKRKTESFEVPQDFWLKTSPAIITTMVNGETIPILEKMNAWPGRINPSQIFCGLAKTGFGKAIGCEARPGTSEILVAGDITDYHIDRSHPRFIADEYLSKKQRLTFSENKLLFPGIAKNLCSALDLSGAALGRVYFIPQYPDRPDDLYYLLGLFNSTLLKFYYYIYYWPTHMAGGYLRINSTYLATLPIPYWPGSWEQEPEGVSLVSRVKAILTCETATDLAKADVSVFKLFGVDCALAACACRFMGYNKDSINLLKSLW